MAEKWWWLPGWPTCLVLLGCLVTGTLDIYLLLPHPIGLAAESGARQAEVCRDAAASPPAGVCSPRPRGLASPAVRRFYHEELGRWAAVARGCLENKTVLLREFPGNASDVDMGSPECRLASRAVQERWDAKTRARLTGSAISHLTLFLRDKWVYGSGQSFVAMLTSRRKKMEEKGQKPTQEEVCRELAQSSLRSNKDYDKAAKAMEAREVSYGEETFQSYLLPTACLVAFIYFLELFLRLLQPRPAKPLDAKASDADSRAPTAASQARARGAAALGRPEGSARRRSNTPVSAGRSQADAKA